MKVKFVPQNVEFEIKPNESVMHVAQDHGIYIKSVCKGVPSCAECRVRIVEGEHNVLPPASEELSLIGTGHFIDRRRLSCQLKCFGDITVDMNEQIAKENGTLVGRKKKLAVKDDRVEQAVRRSEASSETDSEDGEVTEGGEPRAPRPPREDRGGGGGGGNRDRQPRGERGGQREGRRDGQRDGQRDSQRDGRGPREARGPRPEGAPGSSRPAGSGAGGPRPERPPQSPRPEGQSQQQNASGGEPREGAAGGKRRRRRRGKGGGAAGGEGAGPSRPSQGPNTPKPPQN